MDSALCANRKGTNVVNLMTCKNKMEILEEAYDWVREHPEYRFQLSFYEYNKFEVVK